MIRISVWNRSTVVGPAEMRAIVAACQMQIQNHFCPEWGIDALVTAILPEDKPHAGDWQLVVLDNSDQAGALGYHEITTTGRPVGFVFAKDDLEAGELVSATVSHEILEMLIDPRIDRVIVRDYQAGKETAPRTKLYALEVCDPCQDDRYAYSVKPGLPKVSDFCLPAWFNPAISGPKTFNGNIVAPFALATGGYIATRQIGQIFDWQDEAQVAAALAWKLETHGGETLPAKKLNPLLRKCRRGGGIQ